MSFKFLQFVLTIAIFLNAAQVASAEEKGEAAPIVPVEAAGEPLAAPETPSEATPASAAPEAPAATPEPEQDPVTHSRILPVKIKPMQEGADGVSKAAPNIQPEEAEAVDSDTLALYADQASGSYGDKLWQGMSRNEIVTAIKSIPVSKNSSAQREIALRMILSKSQVPLSQSEPKSPDIFIARLTKLVELGAFKEALSIYEKLQNPPAIEEAALAGMLAFIANGQIAVACLEQKALDEKFEKKDPFWAQFGKFCQAYIENTSDNADPAQALMTASLKFAQSEKITPPSKFEDLNNLSAVELLTLSKSGILDQGKWNVGTASNLEPRVVSFLLNLDPISSAQKLSLATVAVEHGILTPAQLGEIYTALSGSKLAAPWAEIIDSYAKIQDGKTVIPNAKLKTLLGLVAQDSLMTSALLPLADALMAIQASDDLSQAQAASGLRVLIKSGKTPEPFWVSKAFKILEPAAAEESAFASLLKVWGESEISTAENEKEPKTAKADPKREISKEMAYSLVLKDFIAAEAGDKSGQKGSYDNFFSLTVSGNYVMPSDVLTEDLKRAAQAKHLGKVLLSGLKVLNGQKMDNLHPKVVYQVLKAYKTAGLSEETESLAYETLLGLTTEKKEN